MKTKLIACAALLMAACCGSPSARKAAATKTEVKHGPEIVLAAPDTVGGTSVNEALANRRSWREYAAAPLTLEELSGVVWAAAGINRPGTDRLTAPSALALYPVRVYAFFAEGVYRYDARAHKLVRVLEGDRRKLTGMQDFVFAAPLNLVYLADRTVLRGPEYPGGACPLPLRAGCRGLCRECQPLHGGARPALDHARQRSRGGTAGGPRAGAGALVRGVGADRRQIGLPAGGKGDPAKGPPFFVSPMDRPGLVSALRTSTA